VGRSHLAKSMAFQLDPGLIRSFARETVRAFSLPPAPGSLDDSCNFEKLEPVAESPVTESSPLPPPPPLLRGSCAAMDSYASNLRSSVTASQNKQIQSKMAAKTPCPGEFGLPEGPASQNTRTQSTTTVQTSYPGAFGLPKRHGSEHCRSVGLISEVSTDAGHTHSEGESSTDAGNTHSEGESCSQEGGVAEDPNSDEEGSASDSPSLASDRTQKKDDGPTLEEDFKPLTKHLAKVPWDSCLLSKRDLKSNNERCACGHMFRPDDSFCLRCGNRRPVDVKSLPQSVEPVRIPPIEDVCERLTACGEAYRQRKENLKLLKRKNEAEARRQEHSGTPAINPLSCTLAESVKPLSERYEGVLCVKENKLQRERERQAAESIMQYTGAPAILPKSKRLDRSVDSLYRWKEKVDRKTAAMRARSQDLEVADCTFNPHVGNYSRRLAMEHEERNGNQAVHQRLYGDAQIRMFTLQAQRAAMAQQLDDMPNLAGSRRSSRSRGISSARKSANARCMPSPPQCLPSSSPLLDEHVLPSPPPLASEFINKLTAERYAAPGWVKSQLSTTASLNKSSRSQEPRASAAVLPTSCKEEQARKGSKTCKHSLAGSFRSINARDDASVLSRTVFSDTKDEKLWTEETNCVKMTRELHDLLATV